MEDIRQLLTNCPTSQLVMEGILQLDKETCMKACVLLWIWWFERNKANQGENIRRLDEISYSIRIHISEYLENLKTHKELKHSEQKVWSPSGSGGWGFTIKNELGEMLVAGAGNLESVADPFHAEL